MSEAPTEAIVQSPAAQAGSGFAAQSAKAVSTRRVGVVAALLLALAVVSVIVSWQAQRRVGALQQELVRRQQDSQIHVAEALMLAKQAQESMRETGARVALLEARLAEVAVQRSQLEELIQSLSRSRDENLLVDIDSGLRVATQQAAITGSAEPLVSALKQADERLAHHSQPRLEGVRRAIARDLDRVKGVGMADIPSLSIKLDEAVRLIDELPLLSTPERERPVAAGLPKAGPGVSPGKTAALDWLQDWKEAGERAMQRAWAEVKALVRVTRIEHPEAMLLSPEQGLLIRENLKLRLLNARLALLSRQFDIAQSDLQRVQSVLDRYFDPSSRRLTLATELIKRVMVQARQHGVARPDDTLAALAAASAGR